MRSKVWKETIDGYEVFLKKFIGQDKGDEFVSWVLNEATIFIDKDLAKKAWEELKKEIKESKAVDIRLNKEDTEFNQKIEDLYGNYNIKVKIDNDGNSITAKRLKLTGYRKDGKRNIYGYTIVHVWDYTKNPYLFSAPWNLCYMPTIAAPLTDHMGKGGLADKMQKALKAKVFEEYGTLIEDYNKILEEINAEQISDDIKSTFSGHALEEMKKQWEKIEL